MSDEQKRKQYDQFGFGFEGAAGAGGPGGPGGFGGGQGFPGGFDPNDIFSQFFGGGFSGGFGGGSGGMGGEPFRNVPGEDIQVRFMKRIFNLYKKVEKKD